MTLTEFLRARFDEDAYQWEMFDAPGVDARKRAHARRHILDIEAKRRIVEWAETFERMRPDDMAGDFPALSELMTFPLRALALPYANHSDYDPDWRPA